MHPLTKARDRIQLLKTVIKSRDNNLTAIDAGQLCNPILVLLIMNDGMQIAGPVLIKQTFPITKLANWCQQFSEWHRRRFWAVFSGRPPPPLCKINVNCYLSSASSMKKHRWFHIVIIPSVLPQTTDKISNFI